MIRREFILATLAAIFPARWFGKGKPKADMHDLILRQGKKLWDKPVNPVSVDGMPLQDFKWHPVAKLPEPALPIHAKSLEWRVNAGEHNRWYLFADGVQVGGWCSDRGGYWVPYDAKADEWGYMEDTVPYANLPPLPELRPGTYPTAKYARSC